MAIDGTCLDVADTPDNDAWFGRPGVNKGERAAFPQARVVGLVECGTHAVLDAEVGAYTTPENTLAGALIDRLQPGTVVLADSRSRAAHRDGGRTPAQIDGSGVNSGESGEVCLAWRQHPQWCRDA